MSKHKWHDEIVAWAGGAEIEFRSRISGEWESSSNPNWDSDFEWRIKPQDICKCQKQTCPAPKQPKYLYVFVDTYANKYYISPNKDTTNEYIGKIEVQND